MKITLLIMSPFIALFVGFCIAYSLGYTGSKEVELISTLTLPVIFTGAMLLFRQFLDGESF